VSEPVFERIAVDVNGVELVCLTDTSAGDDAPLALCLHGFPDTAVTWRHLLPRLARAGYRVAAPYLRGYAPSALDVGHRYQSGALAADANALHDALNADQRAVIIGHDWGAPATYGAATSEPQRWHRVVGMAVPPGPALATALIGNLDQLKRSWYMFFFQHPLSDMVVAADDMAFIDMIWRDWSPGYDFAHDTAAVKRALGVPANLAAALGYYRATLGDGHRDPELEPIQAATQMVPPQPTLYIHGRNDGCIGLEVAEAARSMCADTPHVRFSIVDDAGHFAHLERPDAVNDLIIDFLERP
jgi:pimeloyl-ACP methyl ester carboxylesterase